MSFNTTGVTGAAGSSLSIKSSAHGVSSNPPGWTSDQSNNLGHGLGKAIRVVFDYWWSGVQKLWAAESTPVPSLKDRVTEAQVKECGRQLDLALVKLGENAKDSSARAQVERLGRDYMRCLDREALSDQEILVLLKERVAQLAHPRIKKTLQQLLPTLFTQESPAGVFRSDPSSTKTKRSVQGAGFPPVFDLTTLNGANGFVVNGPSASLFGETISKAGDINKDGIGDFVVTARDGFSQNGGVYTVFGARTWMSPFNVNSLNGPNGFLITGQSTSQLGGAASWAGDINNDGIDDIVMGAIYGPSGTYVLFGNSGGWSSPLGLSFFNGTNGFVVPGGSIMGEHACWAGDINKDGIADLIMADGQSSPGGQTFAGTAWAVFGHSGGFSPSFNLTTLNGANGFVAYGLAAGDGLGNFGGIGDVNQDGIDDFVLGAPGVNANAGAAYVFFGHTGGWTSPLNLVSLNGVNGFVVNGLNPNYYLTYVTTGVGDINKDGVKDFVLIDSHLVASHNVYVIFGHSGPWSSPFNLTALNGTNGFVINSGTPGDQFGISTSWADVNNDGISDLLIGASTASPGGLSYAGSVYVIYGRSGGYPPVFNLTTLDGTNGFTIPGVIANSTLGWSVSGLGDVNQDGIEDIGLGAPAEGFNGGIAYVIFGRNATIPVSSPSTPSGSGLTMSSLSPMSSIIPTPLSNISTPMGPSFLCSSFDSDCQTLTWGLLGSVVGIVDLGAGIAQLKKNIDDRKTRRLHDLPRYIRHSLIHDRNIYIEKIDNFDSERGSAFVTFCDDDIKPAVLKWKKVGNPKVLTARELDSITTLVTEAISKEVDQDTIKSTLGCCGKRIVDLGDVITHQDKIIARMKSSDGQGRTETVVQVSDQDDTKAHPLIEKPSSRKSK